MPSNGTSLRGLGQGSFATYEPMGSDGLDALTSGPRSKPVFIVMANQFGSSSTYAVGFSNGVSGFKTPQEIAEMAAAAMTFSDFAAWLACRSMDEEEDV
jgi:hypothetical protein